MGLSPALTLSATSKDMVRQLLLANAGVSFLPEYMCREWDELVIRPFDGPLLHRTAGFELEQSSHTIAPVTAGFEKLE